MKMRPIVCNTELAFVFPDVEERKVNMKRKRKPSDEQVRHARSRYQEIFYQYEANLEYLYDQLTERLEKYQIQKKKQLANKAKYAYYKNKNGQNYIRVGLSAEREFYFQELHYQEFKKRNQRSQSLALPKIDIKKTEPCPLTKKKEDTSFIRQRKVIHCSYQKELKQMRRSFDIALKLEHDDQRVMKQKTLDIKPQQKKQYKHDDNTFLTFV